MSVCIATTCQRVGHRIVSRDCNADQGDTPVQEFEAISWHHWAIWVKQNYCANFGAMHPMRLALRACFATDAA